MSAGVKDELEAIANADVYGALKAIQFGVEVTRHFDLPWCVLRKLAEDFNLGFAIDIRRLQIQGCIV